MIFPVESGALFRLSPKEIEVFNAIRHSGVKARLLIDCVNDQPVSISEPIKQKEIRKEVKL